MPWVKIGPVYQLKITLLDLRPPVWRRVLVPGEFTLGDLHSVIQLAMGWTDSHLHRFDVGGTGYSLPYPGTDWEESGDEDSSDVRLDQVAPGENAKFMYEYDFGDSWEHEVLVEKISPPDPTMKHPVCLTGKRACPPEDVGGVWGYAEFLQAIRNPKHPEHDSMLEWVGGEFDPAAFDLEETNRALRSIK
ncbi:MAG: plasmid pRiA4b ORF-3 family protein [Chloroflexi bacterium]|nr:plasmid pRiA4b ORF-3 family protein [Chloroflexota bacterium]